MIRVTPIANSAAAKAYFKSADYYIEGQEQQAHWHGKGAERLGLIGPVDYADFEKLCDNINPATGRQLTAKHLANRRVGYDFTFSVPKSFSVAFALGLDDRLPDVFRSAIAETMAEVEREMETRVRRGGLNENRRTGNMLWADFLHTTSRPIKGQPDPQLHVHAVVFNATFDREEDQWKAGEFAALKANAPYFQAVFRSRLATKLQDMGYVLRKSGRDDFELAGVPERTVKEFSRRTAQIEKLADQLGITNPASKAKLGATSRDKKVKGLTWEELLYLWGDRVTPDEQRAIRGTVLEANVPVLTQDRSKEAVDWSLRHLLERNSVVPQRQVVTEALRHGLGEVTPEAIYAELGSRKDVIRRKVGGVEMVSTQGVLREEKRIVEFAVKGRGRCRPLRSPERAGTIASLAETRPSPPPTHGRAGELRVARGHVTERVGRTPEGAAAAGELRARAITVTPSDTAAVVDLNHSSRGSGARHSYASHRNNPELATLSPSQQAAVRHVWTSPDRLILIRGAAGTGKTTLTRAALDGVSVPWVILAPSAEASRGVLVRDGFTEADTLARFLMDERFQEKARNGLVWLDEASLAGAHDLARLTELADSLGARVVLSGDRKQHKSVARGDVLALLEDRAGLPVAEVSEIKRQSGEYKRAVELLAKGRAVDGFRKLDDLGWVVEANQFPDPTKKVGFDEPDQLADLRKVIADDYLAALRSGKSVLVVSPTHAEGEKVTAAIREKLKQDGRLKGEERTFERLVPLHLTNAEKGGGGGDQGATVAVFHRAAKGFKAGERVRCDQRASVLPEAVAPYWSAYRADSLRLAAGDALRITANGKSLDGHRLNNGANYTVAGFTDRGDIRLNNGWVISKSFGHLAPGYVATSHAAQGRTVDVALVAMGNESLPAMSAEQFYVSASRARHQTKVYVEDKEAVLDAIRRDDTRLLASDLVRQPRHGLRQRLKKHLSFLRRVVSLNRDHHFTLEPQLELTHDR